MNKMVQTMLKKYNCASISDYENALKEIIQEIALLGLWRAKFFEVGAFYGGTSLRILYGLDRFSEDMDFSLLKSDRSFDISIYEKSLARELAAFDFEVTVEKKLKAKESSIESAFIKANTLVHLLKIEAPMSTHKSQVLKIKIEVDTDPPAGAITQAISVFSPIPFTVKSFDMPSLFAGKLAATLYRPYKFNTKGRDWYDFLWYISRGTQLNVEHFQARIAQIGKWPNNSSVTIDDVKRLMRARISELNLAAAKADVLPFVKDQHAVELWTKDLLLAAVERIH
jgi:predicted nucleotidyltransferase component of viral defense system